MISKSTAKFIKSLQLKKFRKQHQLFTVEGEKSVLEVLHSDFKVITLVATDEFIADNDLDDIKDVQKATPAVLSSIGSYKTNNSALAVVEMRSNEQLQIGNEWVIMLDGVNDPGNLGTIIRIADWYGITKVVASLDTADFYNPKVIAASKGSFTRVGVYYKELKHVTQDLNIPVYVAAMEGQSIHSVDFPEAGIVILGNEAHGISKALMRNDINKITIPRFGEAESLNVGVATAIICDNIMRGAK